MLDAFIIEELKRREQAQQKIDDAKRPRLELPLHSEIEYGENGEATSEDDMEEADTDTIQFVGSV